MFSTCEQHCHVSVVHIYRREQLASTLGADVFVNPALPAIVGGWIAE